MKESAQLLHWDFGALRQGGGEMLNVDPVLIICAEGESRGKVIATIQGCGLRPVSCSTLDDARPLLARQSFSVIFCSDALPDGSFRAVVQTARSIPVIVLSSLAEWENYLAALGDGAFDYIACPPNPAETERILWCALRESSRIHRAAQVAA